MISLEFTTTACNRAELLDRTYSSYCSNLKGIDFRNSTLYINVDPTPNISGIERVEQVAGKYFGNVVVNLASTPNFSKAVIWCFSQVKGRFFFHLEDDWQLLRKVHINQLISRLGVSDLQCILNKKKSIQLGEPSFVPSLFSTSIVNRYLPHMKEDLNPEAQMKWIFREKTDNLHLHRSKLLNTKIELSQDIGRSWLESHGLTRNYDTPGEWSPWITWRKK